MKVFIILSLALLALGSCNSEETKDTPDKVVSADMESVKYLAGTWVDRKSFGFKQPPQHVMETWHSYPDSISGMGYFVTGTDSSLTEYISIQMVNNKLTYIARPEGQAMVSFTLIENKDGAITFENKANEYPQRITYQKRPNDSLYITLDGVANGIERRITFKYAKEK